jgi:hypothetical protein
LSGKTDQLTGGEDISHCVRLGSRLQLGTPSVTLTPGCRQVKAADSVIWGIAVALCCNDQQIHPLCQEIMTITTEFGYICATTELFYQPHL